MRLSKLVVQAGGENSLLRGCAYGFDKRCNSFSDTKCPDRPWVRHRWAGNCKQRVLLNWYKGVDRGRVKLNVILVGGKEKGALASVVKGKKIGRASCRERG